MTLKVVVGLLSGPGFAFLLVASQALALGGHLRSSPPGLSLLRLRERDTPSKLDVLYKMNCYQQAIMLAKQAKYSDAAARAGGGDGEKWSR